MTDRAKDRRIILPLRPGVAEILYLRSSMRPLVYAVVLRRKSQGRWQAVVSIDNNHERAGVDSHHLHRYIGGEKQEPESLPFSVVDTNDAMSKAIQWLADNWEDLAP